MNYAAEPARETQIVQIENNLAMLLDQLDSLVSYAATLNMRFTGRGSSVPESGEKQSLKVNHEGFYAEAMHKIETARDMCNRIDGHLRSVGS